MTYPLLERRRGRKDCWVISGALSLVCLTAAAQSPCDLAHGTSVFEKCALCHVAVKSAPATVGPNLFAVVGRRAGTLRGFGFTSAMRAAGWRWDIAKLDQFLTDPGSMVPGTAMAFTGLKRAADRADVICYLDRLH